ncbi:hypothetical protein AB4142_38060, partial [Variovorax sp. 2RAF20]
GLMSGKDDLVASFQAFDRELANDLAALNEKVQVKLEQVAAYRRLCGKALLLLGKSGDELE